MGEDSHEWKQEGVWEIFLPSSQFCWAPKTALEYSLQRKIPRSFLVITLQKNQSYCHLRRWKKMATVTRCCDGKDGGEKSGCHGGLCRNQGLRGQRAQSSPLKGPGWAASLLLSLAVGVRFSRRLVMCPAWRWLILLSNSFVYWQHAYGGRYTLSLWAVTWSYRAHTTLSCQSRILEVSIITFLGHYFCCGF